ncbi:MAG TPA: tRNA dimethylallyltransferase [Patescibacteria group bacterium]|nr:tRNA dimethylallyltransferase [Patescibacteria group bacterium]
MALAKRFTGSIIAGDSRTVFEGMDIGTAKPSKSEQQAVPHYLLDIVRPDQPFTAADYKRYALDAIKDIAHQGRVPIIVGGSGLYIDAVLHDFTFRSPNLAERERLAGLSVEELQRLIGKRRIEMPENSKNPRHLVGALEAGGILKERKPLRPNTLIIGLHVPTEELHNRIHERVVKMIELGLEQEVRELVAAYGWGAPALRATIGYQEFQHYFDGQTTIDEVIQRIEANTRWLAKRQRTWFKRESSIKWINKPDDSVDLVTTFLNK